MACWLVGKKKLYAQKIGGEILEEGSDEGWDSPDREFDEEVEELLENDEISSEEAAFLHGWNKDELEM